MKKYIWILVLGCSWTGLSADEGQDALDAQRQAKKLESQRLENERVDSELEDRREENRQVDRQQEDKRLQDRH